MNSHPKNQHYEGAPADSPLEMTDDDEGIALRKYWLMVLERKWYALSVFLVTVLIAATYTFLSTPIYQSFAMVQVLKHGAQVLRVVDVVESSITSDTDFNTQIKLIESVAMVQSVVSRLSSDELKALTDPYKSRGGETRGPVDIVYQNRKIAPQRLSFMIAISFRHPNPKTAARIANLFAEEYIAYNSRVRVEESMKAVDDLKDRADQQRKRVDELANSLQAFRQRGNLISLVQSKDIVTEKLKALNMMATQTNSHLKDTEVRWNQVKEWSGASRPLEQLIFILNQPNVGQLVQQVSAQKLLIAQLRDRYKDKHPRLIEANNALAQAEAGLTAALQTAAASVKAEYENAVRTDEEARKALAEQEAKSLDLDKNGVEYDNLMREFRVNDVLLESMMTRMRETSVTSTIETQNARIVDRAAEPATPVSPKIAINLTMGVLGGLFFGLAVAYFIALVDDRVKNVFDVESLVGLPLVGVIPRVARMEQPDKAQIVSNGADRMIVEAFLSLYSTLRINDESRTAKLILVTSTMPGEGKSFITTNLALAFASQGQRTLVVDCDLRKPNVHRSFRLSSSKGLISYCAQVTPLDDIIFRDVHPNLDVIVAGGRAKNPALLLNSKEFETMIAELSGRYDRILFDTPPLGAVSDALNLLPIMDGAIYTIQYNRVRRGVARRCARRLLSANVPVFGAVLNSMDLRMAGYGEYTDKSYKEYYDVAFEEGAPVSNS